MWEPQSDAMFNLLMFEFERTESVKTQSEFEQFNVIFFQFRKYTKISKNLFENSKIKFFTVIQPSIHICDMTIDAAASNTKLNMLFILYAPTAATNYQSMCIFLSNKPQTSNKSLSHGKLHRLTWNFQATACMQTCIQFPIYTAIL